MGVGVGGARLAHRGTNSPTLGLDLFVGRATRAHFEFLHPISAKNRVGVGIDKSGEDHSAVCVHYIRVVRQIPLDFLRRSHPFDYAVAHQHSATSDDSQIAHFCPGARPRWSRQRHQLRAMQNSDEPHDNQSTVQRLKQPRGCHIPKPPC